MNQHGKLSCAWYKCRNQVLSPLMFACRMVLCHCVCTMLVLMHSLMTSVTQLYRLIIFLTQCEAGQFLPHQQTTKPAECLSFFVVQHSSFSVQSPWRLVHQTHGHVQRRMTWHQIRVSYPLHYCNLWTMRGHSFKLGSSLISLTLVSISTMSLLVWIRWNVMQLILRTSLCLGKTPSKLLARKVQTIRSSQSSQIGTAMMRDMPSVPLMHGNAMIRFGEIIPRTAGRSVSIPWSPDLGSAKTVGSNRQVVASLMNGSMTRIAQLGNVHALSSTSQSTTWPLHRLHQCWNARGSFRLKPTLKPTIFDMETGQVLLLQFWVQKMTRVGKKGQLSMACWLEWPNSERRMVTFLSRHFCILVFGRHSFTMVPCHLPWGLLWAMIGESFPLTLLEEPLKPITWSLVVRPSSKPMPSDCKAVMISDILEMKSCCGKAKIRRWKSSKLGILMTPWCQCGDMTCGNTKSISRGITTVSEVYQNGPTKGFVSRISLCTCQSTEQPRKVRLHAQENTSNPTIGIRTTLHSMYFVWVPKRTVHSQVWLVTSWFEVSPTLMASQERFCQHTSLSTMTNGMTVALLFGILHCHGQMCHNQSKLRSKMLRLGWLHFSQARRQ